MKTISIYTKNHRLAQKWESLLVKNHKVTLFTEFEPLKSSLGEDTYVIFHDDGNEDHIIQELDLLHVAFAKKNTLVLRDVPNLQEGEHLLSHDIGGYGNTHMSDDVFLQAVEVISSANVWLYPELMEHLIKKINALNGNDQASEILKSLTQREKEVALLVAKGESNQHIADGLKISQNTVKLHIASTFEKLNIKNRVALALLVSKAD